LSERLFDRRILAQGALGSIIGSAVLKLGGVVAAIVLGAASVRGLTVALIVGAILGCVTCAWSVWWTRHSYGAMGSIQYVSDGAMMVFVWNTIAVVFASIAAVIIVVVVEGVEHGFLENATWTALWHVAASSAVAWAGIPLGSWLGRLAGFA
jgi:hypothetical protein